MKTKCKHGVTFGTHCKNCNNEAAQALSRTPDFSGSVECCDHKVLKKQLELRRDELEFDREAQKHRSIKLSTMDQLMGIKLLLGQL